METKDNRAKGGSQKQQPPTVASCLVDYRPGARTSFRAWSSLRADLLAFGFPRLTVGSPLPMIGFFQFTMWFDHDF
jgi:hypothetical protein